MPLQLKSVEASRGMRWLVDAFRLYARRPFALTLLFIVFFFASALVATLLPFVGGLLQLMSLPLLSLGFMVASQSALLDGPVTPAQFIEPLRGDPKRRRALLLLCLIYGVAALAILWLCAWMSNDAMTRLQVLLAQGEKARPQIDALLAEPGVAAAGLALSLLGTALTVPFWHAPALVHWGGQSVGQALFSSTLAVSRAKGAFFGYFLGWTVLVAVFGIVVALVFGLLGAASLATVLALPAGLVFSTVFYVSLIFTFNDSFGGAKTDRDAPIDSGP
jgi:hypothetical protein